MMNRFDLIGSVEGSYQAEKHSVRKQSNQHAEIVELNRMFSCFAYQSSN